MRHLHLILTGLSFLSAFALAAQTGGDPQEEAVVFGTVAADMGSMDEEGGPRSLVFRWENRSGSPVAVLMVRTTCACLDPDYDRTPVAPRDSGEIRLTYYPKGHPGGFSHRAFVYTGLSDSAPAAVLTVTGHVKPSSRPVWQYPCRIGSLLLKRLDVNISGDRPQVERIACMNGGDAPLKITAEARGLPDGVTVRCEPETLPPGGTGDLVIGFDPDKAAGVLPDEIPVVLTGTGSGDGGKKVRILIGDYAPEGTLEYPGTGRGYITY